MAYVRPKPDATYDELYAQIKELRNGFKLFEVNGVKIFTDVENNILLEQQIDIFNTRFPKDVTYFPRQEVDQLKIILHRFFEAMENPNKENCARLKSYASTATGAPNYIGQICIVLTVIAGLLLLVVPGVFLIGYLRNDWKDCQRRGMSKNIVDTTNSIAKAGGGFFKQAPAPAVEAVDVAIEAEDENHGENFDIAREEMSLAS